MGMRDAIEASARIRPYLQARERMARRARRSASQRAAVAARWQMRSPWRPLLLRSFAFLGLVVMLELLAARVALGGLFG